MASAEEKESILKQLFQGGEFIAGGAGGKYSYTTLLRLISERLTVTDGARKLCCIRDVASKHSAFIRA